MPSIQKICLSRLQAPAVALFQNYITLALCALLKETKNNFQINKKCVIKAQFWRIQSIFHPGSNVYVKWIHIEDAQLFLNYKLTLNHITVSQYKMQQNLVTRSTMMLILYFILKIFLCQMLHRWEQYNSRTNLFFAPCTLKLLGTVQHFDCYRRDLDFFSLWVIKETRKGE